MPIIFTRADPVALARFDPITKRCSMNCRPHMDDPRSAAERKFLCDDCHVVEPPAVTKPNNDFECGFFFATAVLLHEVAQAHLFIARVGQGADPNKADASDIELFREHGLMPQVGADGGGDQS